MTLKEIRTKFTAALVSLYGQEEADSFFRLLLEFRHGMTRMDFALRPETNLTESDVVFWRTATDALLRQEPIQYLTGETHFCGRRFAVGPEVLIPRPETEELVEWIASEAAPGSRILDIGTGSGAIAVSLGLDVPGAKVSALDVSPQALERAKANGLSNGAEVTFLQQDILQTTFLEVYDIIVSNPPYVRHLEKEEMKPNVLQHEPHLALFVPDDDALLFYRKITELAVQALPAGGKLYFEVNQYLGEATAKLLVDAGFASVELRKDIYGNDRMLRGIKPYS